MPWIARDKTGRNPYRIFGRKPAKLKMVSYEGEVLEKEFTWSMPSAKNKDTYGPLTNEEHTVISEKDCPMHLAPGEGPVEVKVILVGEMPPRPFQGEGI